MKTFMRFYARNRRSTHRLESSRVVCSSRRETSQVAPLLADNDAEDDSPCSPK